MWERRSCSPLTCDASSRISVSYGEGKAHSSSETSVGYGVRGVLSMPEMVRRPVSKVHNRF